MNESDVIDLLEKAMQSPENHDEVSGNKRGVGIDVGYKWVIKTYVINQFLANLIKINELEFLAEISSSKKGREELAESIIIKASLMNSSNPKMLVH